MTRPGAANAPASRPAGAAATATALLVAAGAVGWSSLLGGSVVRVAPLAAVAVLLAARRLSRPMAGGLLVVWLPAALLTAGTPAAWLLPQAWPPLLARLGGGVGRLAPGSGPISDRPWPLAAWLLGVGTVWVAGAALAAGLPSALRRAIAFGVLAAPWVAAVLLGAVGAHQTDHAAAWQGAAILTAGLLWSTTQRMALRPVLALGLAAALVSVATAQAVGPRTRWFTQVSPSSAAAASWTLQTEPTYGPLQDQRSGATLLEITAAEPALWRMQVLTQFAALAGPGWRIGYPSAELPQPAARPVDATVGVRGLRNDLVVSPGPIGAVQAGGTVRHAPGEAWQVMPTPRRGDTYHVRASVVRASAEQLQGTPAPTDPRLRAAMRPYTRLTPGYDGYSVDVPLFGQPTDPRMTAALDRTPYGPVAALARQLAAGARTQWDVVARVHRYLLDADRFRYTTNLPKAGPFPLVDFLLGGHAGDCQHFAGAAALLLRLAGIPTQVVAGFATGVRQRDGRFKVRDVDAHAWIEVYFQGYGWVPFNPTPSAAQAHIPRQLDPLAPAPATPGDGDGGHGGQAGLGWLALGATLAALATAGVVVARQRTRRGPPQLGHLLEGLARRTGGRVQPSSTLAELGVELARLVGPHTAALAVQAERARFAPDAVVPVARPRIRIGRALARDLGPMRALTVLLAPAATRRARKRDPQHSGDRRGVQALAAVALDHAPELGDPLGVGQLPAPQRCQGLRGVGAADADLAGNRGRVQVLAVTNLAGPPRPLDELQRIGGRLRGLNVRATAAGVGGLQLRELIRGWLAVAGRLGPQRRKARIA
jgi:transglutaminase-like putative cysteine protease